jgi:hypothetical protein
MMRRGSCRVADASSVSETIVEIACALVAVIRRRQASLKVHKQDRGYARALAVRPGDGCRGMSRAVCVAPRRINTLQVN